MTSLLTNMSAMSALQNLASTQKSLSDTQNQISSGLRVANASDNAAYWSISTTMKSDTSALSSVSDALNLGSSTLGTATAALTSTLTILNNLKKDVVTAQTPGASATQIQSDVAAQQQSLKSIISSASFNGVNLLDGSAGTSVKFVSSFSRNASGTTSVGFISLDTSASGTMLSGSTGILGTAVSGVTATGGTAGSASGAGGAYTASSVLGFDLTKATGSNDFTNLQAGIDAAITAVTAAGAKLGAAQTTIDTQTSFVSSLSDAITSGVGSLEDADMNVASTKLQALQTQQQLGIQALSIANQNSQLILKLFG
jgi:flagellin